MSDSVVKKLKVEDVMNYDKLKFAREVLINCADDVRNINLPSGISEPNDVIDLISIYLNNKANELLKQSMELFIEEDH